MSEENTAPKDFCNFRKKLLKDYSSVSSNHSLRDKILNIHKKLFEEFVQMNTKERKNIGLEKVFKNFFPIYHAKSKLTANYIGYSISEPKYTKEDCVLMGTTYSGVLKVTLNVVTEESNKDIVFTMGEMPIMTEEGTFIINGHERMFIGQIQKCAGVFFEIENIDSIRKSFIAKIHPEIGSWLHINLTAERGTFLVSVDKKKAFGIVELLLCFCKDLHNTEFKQDTDILEILSQFYPKNRAFLKDGKWHLTTNPKLFKFVRLPFSVYYNGKIIGSVGETIADNIIEQYSNDELSNLEIQLNRNEISNLWLAEDIFDSETGKIFAECGSLLSDIDIELLNKKGYFDFFVVNDENPPFILNTLRKNGIYTREEALQVWADAIKIGSHYGSAALSRMFSTRFTNLKYYDLEGGRARINTVFNTPNKSLSYPDVEDIILTCKELVKLIFGKREPDNIDSLLNKNFVGINKILENCARTGMIHLERTIRDKSVSEKNITDLINLRIGFYQLAEGFYKYSQMVDGTNGMSNLVQDSKVSFKPPGTTKESQVPEQVRGITASQYGKICIQTSEGKNIGLIGYRAINSEVNQDGFIETPYHPVIDGHGTSDIVYVSPIIERDKIISYKSYYEEKKFGEEVRFVPKEESINNGFIVARKNDEIGFFHYKSVQYIDVYPSQIFAPACASLPFVGYCDPYRSLVAANMQSQAVPLIALEAPYIGTGMDSDLGHKILALEDGKVINVDCYRIVIRTNSDSIVNIYNLTVNKKTNSDTVIIHKPLVNIGDKVYSGQPIADGFTTSNGELALGKNLLVAYIAGGYVYEDAFVFSDSVVKRDTLSTILQSCYQCDLRTTRSGNEKHVRDLPGVSNNELISLNEFGVIQKGSYVRSGSILVGKITPTPSDTSNQSPEKKLYNMIFGEKSLDCIDNSLRLPNGVEGIVTHVDLLIKKGANKTDFAIIEERRQQKIINQQYDSVIEIMQSVMQSNLSELGVNLETMNDIKKLKRSKSKNAPQIFAIIEKFEKRLSEIESERKIKLDHVGTAEMQDNIHTIIKVWVASKRKVEVGDKVCGRYGNKGVVSEIWPECDMPYYKHRVVMPDGSVHIEHVHADMIMNPLSILSRMNLGQILETTFGGAIQELRNRIKIITEATEANPTGANLEFLKSHLKRIVNNKDLQFFGMNGSIDNLEAKDIIFLGRYFADKGIFLKFEQFEEIPKEKIDEMLSSLSDNIEGKYQLFDGRNGEPLNGKILFGYQYIERLIHMVYSKWHARSTGPYNLTTNQPTGGRARKGGQRCGEMEVWALQAHGQAYTLWEVTNARSDFTTERDKLFNCLVKGVFYSITATYDGRPSYSFLRLERNLAAVCLSLKLETKNGRSCNIRLMSHSDILSNSHGEVKKEESVNYRTFAAIPDGLFCPKIFGPTKDFCCECKRYKGISSQGIICEKCGVEVTSSDVRRERMGHIQLPVKVVHPWFLKTTNNKISILLEIMLKDIKKIINLETYIVLKKGNSSPEVGTLINKREFDLNSLDDEFQAVTGGEAIHYMLSKLNLEEEIEKTIKMVHTTKSAVNKKKYKTRLDVLRNFHGANIRPEWMVIDLIPVSPPETRPLVQLDGGQIVTSDANDLYRTIIYRLKRLKKMKEIYTLAPVEKSEEMLLQNAVNRLFGTGSSNEKDSSNAKHYKSWQDRFKGKEGDFRKFMLGKRVDFTGRSVIVVAPDTELDECYLPREIALEIYKPMVIGCLISSGICYSIKQAKSMIDNRRPEIWSALEEVVYNNPYVMLNRAPTLHRMGIMSFRVKLWNRKAIGINPLVCPAFNADFDGDSMPGYAIISPEAQAECFLLSRASKNLGSPTSGDLIIGAFKDMAFGIYALTLMVPRDKPKVFSSISSVKYFIQIGNLSVNEEIILFINNKKINTTGGRTLFWEIIPDSEIDFEEINRPVSKNYMQDIMQKIRKNSGDEVLTEFANRMTQMGFEWAFFFNASLGINDLFHIEDKSIILKEALDRQMELVSGFYDGITSKQELATQSTTIFRESSMKINNKLQKMVSDIKNQFNPICMLINSGAKGSVSQLAQVVFAKGNVVDISGKMSIVSVDRGFQEGLNSGQYFLISYGARKGCADVALRTAESGHFTRRLVDVSHSCIVRSIDCGSKKFMTAKHQKNSSVFERVKGRFLALDVRNPSSGKILIPKNTFVDDYCIQVLKENDITEIAIRSVVFCEEPWGTCVACYGSDLSTGFPVNVGEAVGIIAAQAIGEPATQLTMRSFHSGGVVKFSSIENETISGFDGRIDLNNIKLITDENGNRINLSRNHEIFVMNKHNMVLNEIKVPYGCIITVQQNELVTSDTVVAKWFDYMPIISDIEGKCTLKNFVRGVNFEDKIDEIAQTKHRVVLKDKIQPIITIESETGYVVEMPLQENTVVLVNDGTNVKVGSLIGYIRKEAQSGDITDALEKVIAFLENRPLERPAILAHYSGKVSINKDNKARNIITITNEEGSFETITSGVILNVQNGQDVKRGDYLTIGMPTLQDILDTWGIEPLLHHFVHEVKNIYFQQGIKTNEKHIEVILQQMIKRYYVISSEDISVMDDAYLDMSNITVNIKKNIENGIVKVRRVVTGITQAALNSASFLSAASFQEVISVLTMAATSARKDPLNGCKENLILGSLVPCGTGFHYYNILQQSKKVDEQ